MENCLAQRAVKRPCVVPKTTIRKCCFRSDEKTVHLHRTYCLQLDCPPRKCDVQAAPRLTPAQGAPEPEWITIGATEQRAAGASWPPVKKDTKEREKHRRVLHRKEHIVSTAIRCFATMSATPKIVESRQRSSNLVFFFSPELRCDILPSRPPERSLGNFQFSSFLFLLFFSPRETSI